MYRHLVVIVLSLSFAVTACNGGGKKRVPLKNGKGTAVDAKASEGTKNINKVLTDPKCLRVDKFFTALTGLKEETVLVYTSDVNIGTLEAIGGKDSSLLPETNQKIRASAVLGNGTDPLVNFAAAQNIYNLATVTTLYVSAIDSKCQVAAIRAAGGNFDIVKKSADELLLQKQGNPEKSLHYKYDRAAGTLTITKYSPILEAVCGKSNRVLMQKYVIAREQAMEKVELENGYAKVIAENIEEPAELTALLARATGRVSLSIPTMTRIRETLFSSAFVKPVCP